MIGGWTDVIVKISKCLKMTKNVILFQVDDAPHKNRVDNNELAASALFSAECGSSYQSGRHFSRH